MNFIRELMGADAEVKRFPWTRRVYAKLERRPDDEEDNPRFIFQCIDAKWFDQRQLPTNDLTLESFRGARIYLVEVPRDSRALAKAIFFDGLSAGWLAFKLSRPLSDEADDNIATVRENLTTAGWQQRIDVTPLSREKIAELGSVFALPERWQVGLDPILTRLASMGEPHVVAYDVGQGGAVGLHRSEGWVEAYFDFGGGAAGHAHTYPPNLRFCFTQQPLIVLSHWHFDHWVSAKDHDPRALKSTWLVPEQTVGPFQLVLALAIWSSGGEVVVWRESAKAVMTAGAIRIGLCSGSTVNESGLAMLVRTAAGDVLLPGDCGYECLPDFWPGHTAAPRLLGMVAPHHGGKTSPLISRKIPVPAGASSKLVYSSGKGNSYGHARPEVEAEHSAAGWTGTMIKHTKAFRPHYTGHTLLTATPIIPPCFHGGATAGCSLKSIQ